MFVGPFRVFKDDYPVDPGFATAHLLGWRGAGFRQRVIRIGMPADRPQRALTLCMSAEIDAVDRRIKDLLASSIATLPGAQVSDEERQQARGSLLAAHRAWQEYREKTCTAALLYLDNGDAGKLEYLDCKRRLAEQRLHDFELFQPEWQV